MKAGLKRAAQLGLLARDMASARCRSRGPGRDRALRKVVDRLGLMHGLPQKIGQLLAFSELEESSPVFGRLTEGTPSLEAAEAFAAMEAEFGRPVGECFAEIDAEGISASIGQVHRARLQDGREVAVKVQYPGINTVIDSDLRALGWLTVPVGDLRRGFDMDAYRIEIGAMIRAELDYEREASLLRQFGEWTKNWTRLEMPEVVPEFSGAHVLTATWLDGEHLAAALRWPEADRSAAAEEILRFFLHGVLVWRCLHVDPHPGNYRFRRSAEGVRVGVLDFGCVKLLDPRFVNGLRRLVEAARRRGNSRHDANDFAFDQFVEMGFNPVTLGPLKGSLGSVAAVLAEPFVHGSAFRAADWNAGARLKELLGPHRMAFRLAGPSEIIFFLRAFQGVMHYLKALNAPVRFQALWDEALCGSAPADTQRRDVNPSMNSPAGNLPAVKSTSLHIEVREASQMRVALTFDAAAAEHLPMLVPADLGDRLRQRRIDLAEIAADARRRDFEPGELFGWEEGAKSVRVWLA